MNNPWTLWMISHAFFYLRRIGGWQVKVTTETVLMNNTNVFLFSSLVTRFVKDHFDEYRESTIGGKKGSSSQQQMIHHVLS
jgi:hypothetical protein